MLEGSDFKKSLCQDIKQLSMSDGLGFYLKFNIELFSLKNILKTFHFIFSITPFKVLYKPTIYISVCTCNFTQFITFP